MKNLWVVSLAIGLAVLFIAIGMTWGAEKAGLIVAGIAAAYALINVFQGRAKDDLKPSKVLANILHTSKLTRFASVLVWVAAVAVLLVPVVDNLWRDEFTIRVIDENRQPVEGARVDVQFGGEWRPVSLERGEGKVVYYPGSAPASLLVRVRRDGVEHLVTHRLNAESRFEDLVIPLWSGQAIVSVTHFTATDLAIEPFLRGQLPADLRTRFPRVRVLRNAVFETAQQAISLYERGTPFGLGYSQTEPGGNRTRDTFVSASGEADPQLEPYTGTVPNARRVRSIYVPIDWDFSSDILGHRLDRPLAEGFIATITGGSYWEAGDELIPATGTEDRIRQLGSTARSPSGAIRVRLNRSIGPREISLLLSTPNAFVAADGGPEEVRRYLNFAQRQNFPREVIGAAINFDPVLGCGDQNMAPTIGLTLPAPQLRVTILKNTGTAPLNLSAIIMTVRPQSGMLNATVTDPAQEVQMPFDQLEPGEAILIPRELFFRLTFTNAQVAAMSVPGHRDDFQFSLLPRVPSPQDVNHYPSVDGFYHRPRTLTLSRPHVRVSEQDPLVQDLDQHSPDYLAHHSAYLVGPSVREVDYVVNRVRIRARSDPHTTIAMTAAGGEASCPFIFASPERGGRFVNLGQVIRRRIGYAARGRDRLRIPADLRILEIRELEDEVSYIDAVWLIVRSASGERRYPAIDPRLRSEDGRYLVLRRGQRAPLAFRNVPRPAGATTSLEVSGYYEVLRRRPNHRRRQ